MPRGRAGRLRRAALPPPAPRRQRARAGLREPGRAHPDVQTPPGRDADRMHHPLPDGEPFLIVVEPAAAGGGSSASLTVTATSPDGRVLTRFDGVSVVSAPQLAAKFAGQHGLSG